MGENNGVCFRVGKVEAATEGMAEFMVQSHADTAETGAAEPGAVLGVGARLVEVGAGDDVGKGRGEGADTFGGEEVDDRIGVASVEGLDCGSVSDAAIGSRLGSMHTCVRNGVDTAVGAHAGGQSLGVVNIVDDGARQDLGIRSSLLKAVLRLAQDGGHL